MDVITELSSDGNLLQSNLSISEEECNSEKQMSPWEKIKKLEKLLQKSESLRITMKKKNTNVWKTNIKTKLNSYRKKYALMNNFLKLLNNF